MTDSCSESIGSLAFGLHMKRQDDLVAALPVGGGGECKKESELFSINESVVSYVSLEARNICTSQFAYETNQKSFENDNSQWIHLAYKMWRCEITNDDKASGRLLALVNQERDVFALAAEVINSDTIRAYDVLRVIETAMPYIGELDLDGLFRLCDAHKLNSLFFSHLEPVLISRPEVCAEIHQRIQQNPSESTRPLYQAALTSLFKSSDADGLKLLIKDTDSINEIMKSDAIWTLGLLLSNNQIMAARLKDVEGVIKNNISSDIEQIRNSSIQVAARSLIVTNAFDEALLSLAESGDQNALSAIAESLFFNFKKVKDIPGFEAWVRLLSRIVPESHGSIDNLDYILSKLIEMGSKESLVFEVLSDWITKHGQSLRRGKSVAEKFDSTSNAIIQSSDLVSQVITAWYLADAKQLAAAATGFLAELSLRKIKSVKFNCAQLDSIDSGDLILLVRRLIGFVSDEDHLFSLVDSLLDTKDAKKRTYGIVLGLFVNELGEDYPESAIEFLEAAISSETDSDRVVLYSSAIQAIRKRIEELKSLPRLLEMRSNPVLERDFFRARAKQMSKAMEEANKGSIVEMIATKTPLKAGLGWFRYQDGKYSEISFLSHFSAEVSIPRRTVTDEVGSEIQALMMRNVSRDDE